MLIPRDGTQEEQIIQLKHATPCQIGREKIKQLIHIMDDQIVLPTKLGPSLRPSRLVTSTSENTFCKLGCSKTKREKAVDWVSNKRRIMASSRTKDV